MADYVTTVIPYELVNLDAVEALFIKRPPAVDLDKLSRAAKSKSGAFDYQMDKIAKSFQLIARGTSTYVLHKGTEQECKDLLKDYTS